MREMKKFIRITGTCPGYNAWYNYEIGKFFEVAEEDSGGYYTIYSGMKVGVRKENCEVIWTDGRHPEQIIQHEQLRDSGFISESQSDAYKRGYDKGYEDAKREVMAEYGKTRMHP